MSQTKLEKNVIEGNIAHQEDTLEYEVTFEQLQRDYIFFCAINMLKELEENELLNVKETAKISTLIREEIEPYLFELYLQ